MIAERSLSHPVEVGVPLLRMVVLTKVAAIHMGELVKAPLKHELVSGTSTLMDNIVPLQINTQISSLTFKLMFGLFMKKLIIKYMMDHLFLRFRK